MIVTKEVLENFKWETIQEAHGPSYKLKLGHYTMWFIPSNHNVAIYDKNLEEDCQVVYRGKIVTDEQLLMIMDLIGIDMFPS